MPPLQPWPPTKFKRFERLVKSSTGVAIVNTDAGRGYLKAMGNPEGEHALARELVGTHLARWFGLPTLDDHILALEESDSFQIKAGRKALPGPAFITRAIRAITWSGKQKVLRRLFNPDDITRLVVLDTWLLNPDRFSRVPAASNPLPHAAAKPRNPNPDNVLLEWVGSPRQSPVRLIAMDFTHAFTGGPDLSKRIKQIEAVQDEGLYCLFPEFIPFIKAEVVAAAALRLRQATPEVVGPIIARIPREWQVTKEAREALQVLVCNRALWLADRIETLIAAASSRGDRQPLLPWGQGGSG